jgi:endo-1,4-beta-xylanase
MSELHVLARRSALLVVAGMVASLPLRAAETPALKDVFAGKFLVGAALSHRVVASADHPARPLIARHFNSVTSGNAMKWGPYQPAIGEFRHEPADAFVALAEANQQHILGHVLFWHQQTPAWVFQDGNGGRISRAALLERMRERVRELAQRYGGKVDAWDVVNESINDDGTPRAMLWREVLGGDFEAEAFRIAQEELPANAELLYNDYNMYLPGRRDTVVRLIHDLRAKNLRIDAVGMQGHWHLGHPSIAEIEASIVAFAEAGVKIHITELDIEVLPRQPGLTGADLDERRRYSQDPANNPYKDGFPVDMQEKLARRYAEIFALFVKHADVIDRVTFWGVTDGDSWLNNWPVPGRTNHPLLFDRQGQPKPAFDAVIKVGRDE